MQLNVTIVENDHFRHFLSVIDHHYLPVSCTTVNTALQRMVVQVNTTLQERLSKVMALNLTLDIWSDKKMRSYLGITAHYVKHLQRVHASR